MATYLHKILVDKLGNRVFPKTQSILVYRPEEYEKESVETALVRLTKNLDKLDKDVNGGEGSTGESLKERLDKLEDTTIPDLDKRITNLSSDVTSNYNSLDKRISTNANNIAAVKKTADAALPKTGKAADSDKLDGLNSSDFARSTHTHTISQITDIGNARVNYANSAGSAGSATNAAHATNADNATNAGHATSADRATNAGYADSAGSAGSATNAGNADTVDSFHITVQGYQGGKLEFIPM